MNAKWARVLIGGAVASMLLAAGTVIVIADTGGVIFACVNNTNGDVRIVAQQVSCKNNETAAHWNVIGPQGPAGPQGPSGPAGPAGPPGQSGPQQHVVGVVTVESTARGTFAMEAIEFTSGISLVTSGATHATLAPSTFTKVIDKTSPELVFLLAKGAHVTVKVDLCNATVIDAHGNPKCTNSPYATYLYEEALLTKVAATASPMFANLAEEDVTLSYVKLTYTVDHNEVIFDSATNRTS